MLKNRSVPTDVLLPHLAYTNLGEAVDWLERVFGFREHYRYGDPLSGVQMYLGEAWIMLKAAHDGYVSPAQAGHSTQSLTVFVENVEDHYDRTRKAGAQIVEELHETIYGELQYGVIDLDGHHWLFSRHARNAAPEDWGATVARAPAAHG